MDDLWSQSATRLGGIRDGPERLTATLDGTGVEVSRGEESYARSGNSFYLRGVPCTTAAVEWPGPDLNFDVLLWANRWRRMPSTLRFHYLAMKIDDHLWVRCPPWRRKAVRRYLNHESNPEVFNLRESNTGAFNLLFQRLAELGPEDSPPVSMVQVRSPRMTVFAPAEATSVEDITELAHAAVALARSLSVE